MITQCMTGVDTFIDNLELVHYNNDFGMSISILLLCMMDQFLNPLKKDGI